LGYACLVVLSILGIVLLAAVEWLETVALPWNRPQRGA
jgi:hypothetical protein